MNTSKATRTMSTSHIQLPIACQCHPPTKFFMTLRAGAAFCLQALASMQSFHVGPAAACASCGADDGRTGFLASSILTPRDTCCEHFQIVLCKSNIGFILPALNVLDCSCTRPFASSMSVALMISARSNLASTVVTRANFNVVLMLSSSLASAALE